MYFCVKREEKTIYCFNKNNFDIAKISTIENIDSEVENKIIAYLNKNEHNKIRQDFVVSFSDDYELSIGLIGNCNLNCLYCYGTQKNNSKLQLKQIEKTLISINNPNCKIQFVGAGEVLLDFNYFKEAVSLIKKYTKNIWLVTNGTLLTKDVIEYLVTENINITVSMDGGNIQFHDKYRKFKNGNGTYEIITNNLKNLFTYEKTHNKKLTKWISAVITNNNKDLISLYKSFEEIPVDLIMYRFYMGNEKEFSLKDNEELKINICKYIQFIFQKIIHNDRNAYRVINQRDNIFKYLIRLLTKEISIERCGAGKTKSSLYTDGLLYLCDYCSGIKDLSLESFDIEKKDNNNCLKCNYITLCGGYCKYENYIENNYSCFITPIIINQLVTELTELQICEPKIYEKLKNHCKRISLYL